MTTLALSRPEVIRLQRQRSALEHQVRMARLDEVRHEKFLEAARGRTAHAERELEQFLSKHGDLGPAIP